MLAVEPLVEPLIPTMDAAVELVVRVALPTLPQGLAPDLNHAMSETAIGLVLLATLPPHERVRAVSVGENLRSSRPRVPVWLSDSFSVPAPVEPIPRSEARARKLQTWLSVPWARPTVTSLPWDEGEAPIVSTSFLPAVEMSTVRAERYLLVSAPLPLRGAGSGSRRCAGPTRDTAPTATSDSR